MDANILHQTWIIFLIIGHLYRKVNMKKISLFLFSIVFFACDSSINECDSFPSIKSFGLANKSDLDIEVVFRAEETIITPLKKDDYFLYFEPSRKNNVTIYEDCGLYVDGCESSPIDVQIKFLTSPPKCLLFSGNIENRQRDIRSSDAYNEIEEHLIDGNSVIVNQFYITPEMYEQAEHCE